MEFPFHESPDSTGNPVDENFNEIFSTVLAVSAGPRRTVSDLKFLDLVRSDTDRED